MTTAGTAIPSALYDILMGDATLTGLLATYKGTASVFGPGVPNHADFPYVTFRKIGGAPDNTTPSDMRSYLYSVVGFSEDSQSEANQIDNRVDELLDGHSLSLSGYTTLWMKRETELPEIVEHPNDNKLIYRSGAYYRIIIDS